MINVTLIFQVNRDKDTPKKRPAGFPPTDKDERDTALLDENVFDVVFPVMPSKGQEFFLPSFMDEREYTKKYVEYFFKRTFIIERVCWFNTDDGVIPQIFCMDKEYAEDDDE